MSENKQADKQTEPKSNDYLKELVIARIEASSDNLKFMIGGDKEMTKVELINSVRAGNEIGKEIIDAQLEFLKDMAEGKIYKSE